MKKRIIKKNRKELIDKYIKKRDLELRNNDKKINDDYIKEILKTMRNMKYE